MNEGGPKNHVNWVMLDSYWVPGINAAGKYGCWAFAEFTDVFEMQDDFAAKVQAEFGKMVVGALS